MISISIHKDKRGGWQMRVMDTGSNGEREILRGGAATPREAAVWLLRNVNKLAAEVEERLVELGLLSEAECEAVLAESDAESDGNDKEQLPTAVAAAAPSGGTR